MAYLVTYIDEQGNSKAFYTNWFEVENHFDPKSKMVVYDLKNHRYMDSNLQWIDIEQDHL